MAGLTDSAVIGKLVPTYVSQTRRTIMNAANKRKFFSTLIGAVLCAASLGANAYSFPTDPPDLAIPFDVGLACHFPLTLEQWDGKTNTREFTDKQGNLNIVVTGKGHDFRFTNAANGRSTTQMSQGVQQHIVVYPDGSLNFTTNGALLLIMFPTDIPAGPSTTYYNGHTELFIAADGVGTLQPPHAHARDICAELS
jgi:hypothetical protein